MIGIVKVTDTLINVFDDRPCRERHDSPKEDKHNQMRAEYESSDVDVFAFTILTTVKRLISRQARVWGRLEGTI